MSQTTVRPRDSSLKIDYRPWEKMFLHERDSPPGRNVGVRTAKIKGQASPAPLRQFRAQPLDFVQKLKRQREARHVQLEIPLQPPRFAHA